jgi:hypothetical protein
VVDREDGISRESGEMEAFFSVTGIIASSQL